MTVSSMPGRGQVPPARGCNLISCYKSNRRLLFIWNLEPIIKTVNNSKLACYSHWQFMCQDFLPYQSCKLCTVPWHNWTLPICKVELWVVRDLLYRKFCCLCFKEISVIYVPKVLWGNSLILSLLKGWTT